MGEQDAEVAAWTITRDENSWSALLTLTDTGNQAVSCMPAKLYKRLCLQNGQKYALEEYPVPIIGVGSKRIISMAGFEGISAPAKIRFLVISSLAKPINIGLRDLEKLEVTLELSKRKGNFMLMKGEKIKLHGKQEAAFTAD